MRTSMTFLQRCIDYTVQYGMLAMSAKMSWWCFFCLCWSYYNQKNIKNAEESRTRTRRIQKKLQKNKGTGITRVTKVDPLTNELIDCTIRKEVETVNLEYLPDLFSAPMTHLYVWYRYSKIVGYTGDKKSGYEVTAGTYIPPQGTDEYTKLFLKCARQPAHVPDLTISERFITTTISNVGSADENKHLAVKVADI